MMKKLSLRRLAPASVSRLVMGLVLLAATVNCQSDESTTTAISIALSPTDASIRPGDTVQFSVIAKLADGSAKNVTAQATYLSTSPEVLTVDATGNGVGVALGSSFVVATYQGISSSAAVTVDASAPTLTSIAVTPVNSSIALGTTQSFVATGSYSNNTTRDLTGMVTWTSSAQSVATIAAGRATAVAVGTTVITASFGTTAGNTMLTVSPAIIVSIALTPTTPSVAAGSKVNFTATATLSNNATQDVSADATWTSSAPTVATVDKGSATTLAAGRTTIEATVGAIKGSTVLTVSAATLVSIAVTPSNPSIARGTTQQFTVTGTFSNNTTQNLTDSVVWTSGIPTVATIGGSTGLATGVAAGTTVIRATIGAISGTSTLSVTPATLVSISVSPTNPTVPLGVPARFTATGIFSDNSNQDLTGSVTWASATAATASISNAVDSKGEATTLAVGTTVISATQGTVSATSTLTVTAATLASIEIAPALPSIANGTTRQFTATGVFTDATRQDLTDSVTWSSATPAVATISNADGSRGLATSASLGMTVITAASGNIMGTTTLTVAGATLVSIAVTPANPTLARGTTTQLTATGTYTDNSTQDLTAAVTWASTMQGVATVSGAANSSGLVTAVLEGTTSITATLDAIMGATTITVSAATLSTITVTPAGVALPVGISNAYVATGTYSDNTTQVLTTQVTWSSSDTNVATISIAVGSEGVAIGVAPGSAMITATLGTIAGSTTLTITTATIDSITVTPASPTTNLNGMQQFVATATMSDNTTAVVTTQVTWGSSDAYVADISNDPASMGLATALMAGTTTISAQLGTVTGTTNMTVVDPNNM